MNTKYFIAIMVFIASGAVTGCGTSSGDNGDPNAPAAITMTVSRGMALANSTDAVTIQAMVAKADGTAVADGTVVAFEADTAALSAPTAVTTNGMASVSVTCGPVAGAKNYKSRITAAAGSASGICDIKFINQPASVDVSVGLNVTVTNLAALQFKLLNTSGATYDNNTQLISRINNAAADSTAIVLAGFDAATGALTVGLANSMGFNTGSAPVLKATFAVAAGSGLPVFTVDTTPGNFIASDPSNNPTNPRLTASNLVISTVFDTEL